MSNEQYKLIVAVIRKQKHKERYGVSATNPYSLALQFVMERLVALLEGIEQQECQLIAEARGKNEDDALRLSFLSIINYGTFYVSSERFKNITFRLVFVPKSMNIVGTQLADLAAYPIARYVIDKDKPNPAYNIIRLKMYRGTGAVYGLKIFP